MSTVELIFSFEDGKSETFKMSGKSSFIIGRSNDCDIVLPYEGFSRKHCKVDIENGDIFLTDLKSANGVLVGGEKIPPEKKVPYQTFLNLQIGTATNISINLEDTSSHPSVSISRNIERKQTDQKEATRAIRRTVGESTKTHVLKRPNQKSKVEKEGNNFKAVALLIILGVAGVVYYFNNQAVQQAQNEEALAQNATPVKPPALETSFTPSDSVMGLYGQQTCEGAVEKEWCGHLGLRPEISEGIINRNDSILCFINIEEDAKLLNQEKFSLLRKSEQHELLLLRKIVQSVILSQLKRSNITNIQFIAIENNAPVFDLKINRDYDDSILKRGLAYPIIDEGLNQGITENLKMIRSTYQTRLLP